MVIAIVGGGAAGFMAAITAAENFPEARVMILEKSNKVLGKVRVSGGGRCNVTHRPHAPAVFAKSYPRGAPLLKKYLLAAFDAAATVQWFGERGVRLKTEEDGRMFPVTDTSDTVVFCLMEAARNAGVAVLTGVTVSGFTLETGRFKLSLKGSETVVADRLLVATGGYPKPEGFSWLTEHRHVIAPPVPSLFTFNMPGNDVLTLAGVSVKTATVRVTGTKLMETGPLLITHWGLSGPVILKLSAWGARELAARNYRFEIRINWTGTFHPEQVRDFLLDLKENHPKQQLEAHPQFGIPARLWKILAAKAGIEPGRKQGELTNKVLNRFTELLTNGMFEVSGKTTFKEEFVTCGGVGLEAVDPQTMESRSVKGLFFAGEVLDVDGITGGFNFQHAWSSGYVAGKNIGK